MLTLCLVSNAWAAPEGLVAHWAFDEGSGTTAFDSTGNGNHGEFVGSPQWVPGQIGGALSFDGSSWLNCGNGDSLQIRDQITFAFWFQVEAFVGGWAAFFGKGDNSYRASRANAGNATHMGIQGTSVNYFNGTVVVTDGTWHHYTATYDGTTASIYIDGVLDTAVAATGQINISSYNLFIGTNSEITTRAFTGLLDDFQLYNRGLSVPIRPEARY